VEITENEVLSEVFRKRLRYQKDAKYYSQIAYLAITEMLKKYRLMEIHSSDKRNRSRSSLP